VSGLPALPVHATPSHMAKSRAALLLPVTGLLLFVAGALLWRFGAPIDQEIFGALRLDPGSAWVRPVGWFTHLGGLAVLGPLGLAVVGWLLWRKRGGQALWLLLTIASGRLIVEAAKLLFERGRPPSPDRLATVTSYSFPSSHSAGTMLTWLALAMLLPARSRTLLPLALLMGGAIGWSRIALAVHWPSDVIAGFGLAMLWVGIARRWLPRSAPR